MGGRRGEGRGEGYRKPLTAQGSGGGNCKYGIHTNTEHDSILQKKREDGKLQHVLSLNGVIPLVNVNVHNLD